MNMPASPIRKLVPYAEKAKKKGVHIYHLNIGQPDIETPAIMLDAVKNFSSGVVEYSHSAGIESYRKKLSEYYKRHNINVDFNEIIVTTGGSEAIEMAMMCCLNPGNEVIITEPFYANYNGFACMADIKVKAVKSTIENGFALPPLAAFEEVISDKTRAILICNPSNPTGYLYSREELEQLKKLVLKHDLFLLSDEVYREFCYDSKEFCSVFQLGGLDKHVVLLDSISKRYSACGVRIGALVSKNKTVIDAAMKFAQARLSPPTFGQIAGEAGIDTPASYFTKVNNEYTSRRDFVVEELNKMEGVYCPKPSGAFYAMASLPVDDADIFCQWLLESFQFKNQTVMLAPASGFYATSGLGKNEVRIAYVLNLEDLKNAMNCLREALHTYPGKTLSKKKETENIV